MDRTADKTQGATTRKAGQRRNPAWTETRTKTRTWGNLRDEAEFEDEFPLDFSEMGGVEGLGDVSIPF